MKKMKSLSQKMMMVVTARRNNPKNSEEEKAYSGPMRGNNMATKKLINLKIDNNIRI